MYKCQQQQKTTARTVIRAHYFRRFMVFIGSVLRYTCFSLDVINGVLLGASICVVLPDIGFLKIAEAGLF